MSRIIARSCLPCLIVVLGARLHEAAQIPKITPEMLEAFKIEAVPIEPLNRADFKRHDSRPWYEKARQKNKRKRAY